MHTKKRNRLDTIRMNNLVYVQFNARLMNKKKKSNKLETLLASDANKAQSWIAEGCDDDEMENDMLPPKKCSRNAQVEIRELEENDFVLDDTEDELDEDVDIELEFDKELDKS